MKQYEIAVIGLGVMGRSLARNLASRNFRVLTYNRTTAKAEQFIEEHGSGYLDYRKSLSSLAKDLKAPRIIIMMVPAGSAVDETIKKLIPHLKRGDILIDGGNSHFHNTIERAANLKKKGVQFVGMGVSGGEEGALKGPSIMPGCEAKAWRLIAPFLKKMAAKDFKGKPCVTHVGTDGAGHYVKMVHNGIEYAIMQLMAEAYHMLKEVYGLSADEIAKIFDRYNKEKLKSFLFEISVPVLSKDGACEGGNLVDCILDQAAQKGTGRWVALDALERGTPIPTITEAVFTRSISSLKTQRVTLSKLYKKPKPKSKLALKPFTKQLEDALHAGMICSYAQGFELIRSAAKEQNWKLNFAEIARIWEGGCIIRADLLKVIHKAFSDKKGKPIHLFKVPAIQKALERDVPSLRQTVCTATINHISIPAFSTTLGYFDGMTTAVLPANFIQGLRDFFGAHTYRRTDKKGVFHTEWKNLS